MIARRLKIRRSHRFGPVLKRLGNLASFARMTQYIDGLIARSGRRSPHFPQRLQRYNPIRARVKNIRYWFWQIARLRAMTPEQLQRVRASYQGGDRHE